MKSWWVPLLLCATLLGSQYLAHSQFRSVRIIVPAEHSALLQNARAILGKQITARSGVPVISGNSAEFTIEMITEKSDDPEAFRIEDHGKNHIRIIGGDAPGVLYGSGKFLRSSSFGNKVFTPAKWRGSSAPKGKVRGMYFATHFNNFYEAAPIGEVQSYVEELALWGINHLVIHYPNWQFTAFSDLEAQKTLNRFRQIMGVAKACGMKVGLLQVPNQGFKYTNSEFINTPVPDALGRRGHFGVNLDPSNVQARALLKKNWNYLLEQFEDIQLDLIAFWPYDEGGCGCDKCWPWGARGYPAICEELASLSKKKFPNITVVLSTWMYDTPPAGEWEGLTKYLKQDASWVNYIMADSHEDYPRYPLEQGVPANLPLLNFPEISMWGQGPWGGYGANPLSNRFQRLWSQTDNKLAGGFPYSEGIYEDMNKVICAQLYWDGKRSTSDILKEYIAYEFSPDVVNDVSKAIEILESNHQRHQIKESGVEAFRLIEKAKQKLSPQVLKSWRWRILYLRAQIDQELFKRGGKMEGDILRSAFNELTGIYHAQNAHSMPIHPPVIP